MALFQTSSYGLSDIGLVRKSNQDFLAILPDSGTLILADGMGGHQAGEVAAQEAVASLVHSFTLAKKELLQCDDYHDVVSFIKEAISLANTAVYTLGNSHSHLKGMGTTLCCLYIHHHHLIHAHVGDSRIYHWREGKLKLLTKDHSLMFEMADRLDKDPYDSSLWQYRNILTKAVGTRSRVKPSIGIKRLIPGDIYLMCSDGLSDFVPHEEMEEIILKAPDLEQATHQLIYAAKKEGGKDNITVVMAKMELSHETANLSG